MQDRPTSGSDPVAPRMRMTIVVVENWKAEPKNPLLTFSAVRRGCWDRSQHVMYTADEQIILVTKMCVEGRSAHIRAVENLLHDD